MAQKNELSKALGITAMIFAIVSIFIPLIGPYLTIIAGLIAIFSFGKGFMFGIIAILVNLLNIFFLSPSLLITVGLKEASSGSGGSLFWSLVIFQIIFGIILFLLNSKKK